MENINDQSGRKIDYLRVSITDRCNLRCHYCMPELGIKEKSHDEILSYEEIIKIVKNAQKIGINKLRITGGEPLVRIGVETLIEQLSKLGLKDISMTTNGVLLAEKAEKLKKAGLDRVNISLDTLKRDKFSKISRRDNFCEVIKGIEAAQKYGLEPVKLNVVVMKNINDDEILDFVEFASNNNLIIRFIEYMPLGGETASENFISSKDIKVQIKKKFTLEKADAVGNGPAKYYSIQGGKAKLGFISALTNHFCADCNRLRLTADGRLKPCLASDLELKIDKKMTDDLILESFKKALEIKPRAHNLNFKDNLKYKRTMSQIGG
ncbi:GTP 3',8-cyclase MoaA [Halanaerobium sp. Z-7514]|uniref:GTP 3',8-cyclase n=1 Tax=Halanaerobium polyolivorans TaxID=2886943 RepID=A0AAW4WWV0_9FIRM|nr:GTP 3',8-cyclase MoaA [Halanaerobium polyolivorans]MCC3144198.1 GTP 3',8-cyclase MoaA [Halanaerobium polyolivorans]